MIVLLQYFQLKNSCHARYQVFVEAEMIRNTMVAKNPNNAPLEIPITIYSVYSGEIEDKYKRYLTRTTGSRFKAFQVNNIKPFLQVPVKWGLTDQSSNYSSCQPNQIPVLYPHESW
jgi:hypothetical protein